MSRQDWKNDNRYAFVLGEIHRWDSYLRRSENPQNPEIALSNAFGRVRMHLQNRSGFSSLLESYHDALKTAQARISVENPATPQDYEAIFDSAFSAAANRFVDRDEAARVAWHSKNPVLSTMNAAFGIALAVFAFAQVEPQMAAEMLDQFRTAACPYIAFPKQCAALVPFMPR